MGGVPGGGAGLVGWCLVWGGVWCGVQCRGVQCGGVQCGGVQWEGSLGAGASCGDVWWELAALPLSLASTSGLQLTRLSPPHPHHCHI